jgi:hypothetical protein
MILNFVILKWILAQLIRLIIEFFFGLDLMMCMRNKSEMIAGALP